MMKIYRTFILLPSAVFILLAAITGCSAEDDQTASTGEGKKVQVNLNLSVPKMIETGDVSGSTRATTGLTLEEESAIRSLSYFEFSGTTDNSLCIGKGTATMGSSNYIASISLSSSNNLATVYIVANLGDVTGNVTVNTTTLAQFKALTFDYATDNGKETTGLPMIGSTNMIPSSGSGSIVLTRMVAKIRFSYNLQIPSGDSFTISSFQLKNVPNKGKYTQTAGYPEAISANFTDYTSNTLSSATWYVPANMRGQNTGISLATQKSDANAFPYSTYVEIAGVYTYSFGQTRDVIYHFYLGEDEIKDFNLAANKAYNVVVNIKGIDSSDARMSIVNNLSFNALGTQQTANCYIVRDGGKTYKFLATVMGNIATTPASTIISPSNGTQNPPAITPATLSPTNAIVLWETGAKGSVIQDGSITLGADGYVRFNTANNAINGNAVIAVRDATNNILWSWHIWKVPYNPNSDYDTYTTSRGRSFKMMKYNLGATAIGTWNGTATNAGDMGLFYQWGRKDPFVGISGWSGIILQAVTYASGYARATIAKESATVSGSTGADATIRYGIANPATFITGGSNTLLDDWLNVTGYANQRDNLWGNPNKTSTIPNLEIGAKSIYDPCPPGWRVPPPDAFTLFTTTGIQSSDKRNFNVTDTTTFVSNRGYNFYYRVPRSTPSSYYPAIPGIATNGILYGDNGGCYWTSSSANSGNPASFNLLFNASYIGPLDSRGRSNGFAVRCAQE